MAFANLKDNKRLQSVLDVLSDGEPHDIYDLVFKSGQPNAGTIISELRQQGKEIRKEWNGKYWDYKLMMF